MLLLICMSRIWKNIDTEVRLVVAEGGRGWMYGRDCSKNYRTSVCCDKKIIN